MDDFLDQLDALVAETDASPLEVIGALRLVSCRLEMAILGPDEEDADG